MSRRPASPESEQIARRAYGSFAERYDAAAPTKPHNALYERPASLSLLGDVAGLDVVDAGCGSGICTEKLARSGARVRAFDVTPEMLDLARKRCAGLDVDIREGDLGKPLDWLSSDGADAILCSLALDYVEDLKPVFAEFHRIARPGGHLVFSMGHPMRDWADLRARGDANYFATNLWGLHWGGFGLPNPYVESYRRPLQDILNGLADAGWRLDRFVEPLPVAEMEAADPVHFEELNFSPAFICVRAIK
ncbi:class I SAM-dependent DNA methyltransferase [Aminobacter niigataensis]|uniref:class I SAM-dependent DNA methyltransferase n=1 Tax=Aminobacter niigataensis TaxID=83265 RepID=UPI0024C93506|nr:class I SAM-dependent methyltransferase [Aminobacter niigataensis]CAI2934264.1 Malonyl-CoA O-methyltransferase BioC [Aminobacter niigataensis]